VESSGRYLRGWDHRCYEQPVGIYVERGSESLFWLVLERKHQYKEYSVTCRFHAGIKDGTCMTESHYAQGYTATAGVSDLGVRSKTCRLAGHRDRGAHVRDEGRS
ncbi:unnamed protein product, partial [Pylaiella littoralis]